jgi:glycosyltransferase involved in cell wall biosynthesis
MAGASRAQRIDQRARFDQFGAAGIDEQRVGSHPREILAHDAAARLRREPQMHRQHVGLSKQIRAHFRHRESLRRRFGAAARERVRERFSWERSTQATLDAYADALA